MFDLKTGNIHVHLFDANCILKIKALKKELHKYSFAIYDILIFAGVLFGIIKQKRFECTSYCTSIYIYFTEVSVHKNKEKYNSVFPHII